VPLKAIEIGRGVKEFSLKNQFFGHLVALYFACVLQIQK
jgi:hypothetical protein